MLQTRTDSAVAILVRKTFKHVSEPLAILVSLAILVVIIYFFFPFLFSAFVIIIIIIII